MTKPKIRFKGFAGDWEQRKFGEIYELNNERNGSQFTFDKTLSIATMTFNQAGNGADEGSLPNYKVLRVGDIAFEGHTNKEFRYGRFVLNNLENGIMSPRFTTLRPIVKQDYKFWERYIHSELVMRSKLVNSTKAGTMMNELVPDDFLKQCILVPEIEEQEKMGSFFHNLDNLIALHQRKCGAAKKLKKFMLQKMFPKTGEKVPEIRFKGFSGDWEQRKLGEIGTITTGNTPSTSVADYYSEDGMMWVTPTDISGNIIYTSEKKLSQLGQTVGKIVPQNTILVTCIASIGKNTMLGNMGSFNQQINGLTPNEEKYDPYFLLTESVLWSAQMKRSAAAGTMQIVNRTEFSELKTWLPSLQEQQQIGTYFRQLDNLIALYQRECDELKKMKKFMLQNMFV